MPLGAKRQAVVNLCVREVAGNVGKQRLKDLAKVTLESYGGAIAVLVIW